MISSFITFRLKRLSALSRLSPSCKWISANGNCLGSVSNERFRVAASWGRRGQEHASNFSAGHGESADCWDSSLLEFGYRGCSRGCLAVNQTCSLHRESEKAKPNCVGAAFLAAVQTRPQICREAIPPHIGHCRTLGLAGSQPEGGEFL